MIYLNIKKSISNIDNKFDLILISSYYARQIQLYNKKNNSKNLDKPIFLALKKIKKKIFNKILLNIII